MPGVGRLCRIAALSVAVTGAAMAQEAAAPAAPTAAPAEPASAQPAPQAEAKADGKADTSEAGVQLTPEEKAEKEARKACKVEICSAFRNPASSGNDIACDVTKSWRKEQLVKMVSRLKVTWPYGPVKCISALHLKRTDLVKSVTETKYATQLESHAVKCTIEKQEAAAAEINFAFSPKIAFENGKAVSAKMNWGKLEAPTLIKGALWTATAADNTINMLSSSLVDDINDFISNKCDEVKAEWSAHK